MIEQQLYTRLHEKAGSNPAAFFEVFAAKYLSVFGKKHPTLATGRGTYYSDNFIAQELGYVYHNMEHEVIPQERLDCYAQLFDM